MVTARSEGFFPEPLELQGSLSPEPQLVKNPPANSGDARDTGSIPDSGRSPGVGNGNPLQYSCLENSTDRGAWWATVHGVTKSPEVTERTLSHACSHAQCYSRWLSNSCLLSSSGPLPTIPAPSLHHKSCLHSCPSILCLSAHWFTLGNLLPLHGLTPATAPYHPPS